MPSRDGEFGLADYRITVGAADIGVERDAIEALRTRFESAELIEEWTIPVPGAVDQLDVIAQDPRGPVGAPMLALVSGHFPTAADEVALTDGAAALLEHRASAQLSPSVTARRASSALSRTHTC